MQDTADVFLTVIAQRGIDPARALAGIGRWADATLQAVQSTSLVEGAQLTNAAEWQARFHDARVERWRETETVAALLGVLLNWLDETGKEPAYEIPRRQLAALRQEANRLFAGVAPEGAAAAVARSSANHN